MKKLLLVTVFSATFLAACSQPASPSQVFGEQSSNATLTIAQVKAQPDDAIVTFKGKITKQVGGEDYIVADETGSIEVEIDHHIWNGLSVTPNDTLRIRGKVDQETFSTQVDAHQVEKAN